MATLSERTWSSFDASAAAYAKRVAAGTQPAPPAFVHAAAGGALRFLDYRDTGALLAVNAAYLALIGILFVIMRTRSEAFTLRGAMVVRLRMQDELAARRGRIWRADALARAAARCRCRLVPLPPQLYNAVCVYLAAYVVHGIVVYKLQRPGSFACNAPDLSPAGQKLARVLWCAAHCCRRTPPRLLRSRTLRYTGCTMRRSSWSLETRSFSCCASRFGS